jgi:Xaa-Pro aminopeptidase
VAALHDAGLTQGRIGAEIGPEQVIDFPFADFVELQRRFPEVFWVDAGGIVMAARMRKTATEITCLREACRITSIAYERMFAEIAAGMTEIEIARLLHTTSLELGAGATWELITSGAGNYDFATASPTSRRIAPGDMVWLDAGCAVGGYWSDFGRAGVVGGATAEQRDTQRRIHEITMRGVERIRPGATTGEVARVCNEALGKLDLPITSCISCLASRIGHGLGLGTTERPHVADDDLTLLAPGMVITVEPGIATPYGIFHVEENVLVTESGHEILSTTSRELFAIRA